MAYLLSGRAMVSFFLCPVVWRGRPVRLPEYHERKQLFWADETSVSPRGIFYFVLVELLFSAGGTFIFTKWNSYFHQVDLLFLPDETSLFS